MTIIQLEYLLAVANCGSFSLAAEHCFVTQPSLSMQIKSLEEELGVVLLDRSKKPVIPTEAGEVVLAEIRETLRAYDHIREAVAELKGETSGRLRLGVIPTIAPYLLHKFIPRFRAGLSQSRTGDCGDGDRRHRRCCAATGSMRHWSPAEPAARDSGTRVVRRPVPSLRGVWGVSGRSRGAGRGRGGAAAGGRGGCGGGRGNRSARPGRGAAPRPAPPPPRPGRVRGGGGGGGGRLRAVGAENRRGGAPPGRVGCRPTRGPGGSSAQDRRGRAPDLCQKFDHQSLDRYYFVESFPPIGIRDGYLQSKFSDILLYLCGKGDAFGIKKQTGLFCSALIFATFAKLY